MDIRWRILTIWILLLFFNPLNLIESLDFMNALSQRRATDPLNDSLRSNVSGRFDFFREALAQDAGQGSKSSRVDVPGSYVIGQGDVLEVFVWGNEQISRSVTVRPDGKISLPLLQDLQAEGLTALQLKDTITERLREYVQNPTVTVIVSEIHSYKITVLGRVESPGVYPMTTKMTLLEAISQAGGFAEWAKLRKITVIRDQGGKKRRFYVNYKKIISGKDPSQNIVLQQGDTIIVP